MHTCPLNDWLNSIGNFVNNEFIYHLPQFWNMESWWHTYLNARCTPSGFPSGTAFSSLIAWIKREMMQESQITCSSFVLLRQAMCTLNLSNRDFSWLVQLRLSNIALNFIFFLSKIQPTHQLITAMLSWFHESDISSQEMLFDWCRKVLLNFS